MYEKGALRDILRIYDRYGQPEVQIRFPVSFPERHRCVGSINKSGHQTCTHRNIARKVCKEEVKVILRVEIPFLKNAESCQSVADCKGTRVFEGIGTGLLYKQA